MKRILKYKNRVIEYNLKWSSRRKSVALKINNQGELIITAPLGISEQEVNRIVLKKAKWIFNKLKQVQEMQQTIPRYLYVSGEYFYFLGQQYELKVIKADFLAPLVNIKDNILLVKLPCNLEQDKIALVVKNEIEAFFCNKALKVIEDRVNYYKDIINVNPNKITLRNQKTRWGSCSSLGNISINWRITLAPLKIVDYIVVHELCHLKVLNHSKEFWLLVAKYIPNYKECEKWLKQHGHKLII